MSDVKQNTTDDIVLFNWTDNFATGIELIDKQHKKLIALLNKLSFTLITECETQTESVYQELTAYAEFHFRCEEEIWDKYLRDDAWLQRHHKNHQNFLVQVESIRKAYQDKPYNEVLEEVIRFLMRWLTFHILGEDKKLASLIRKLEAGKAMEEGKQKVNVQMENSPEVFLDTFVSMYELLSSRTLQLMKTQAELTDVNARLKEASITDQLTGLYNRRYFNSIFERELKRAVREQEPLCIIMLDIDFFKLLNDTYGHVAGDEALVKVAQLMQHCCNRPADYCFRIGGEEFCVISANMNQQQGISLAEHIRTSIQDAKITNQPSKVADVVTISSGLVARLMTEKDNTDELMHSADELLYKAKQSGRNKVVVAD